MQYFSLIYNNSCSIYVLMFIDLVVMSKLKLNVK